MRSYAVEEPEVDTTVCVFFFSSRRRHTRLPRDWSSDVCSSDLERYIETFADLGADLLTVHYEACTHLHRTLQAIKQAGMKTGVALNPHTNVLLLEDIIQDVDMVLLMSVNPGFGGQKFIENTYKKIHQLKELIIDNEASTKIEVDGGVNNENIQKLADAGADIFVAGSHVFNSENPLKTIKELKELANS